MQNITTISCTRLIKRHTLLELQSQVIVMPTPEIQVDWLSESLAEIEKQKAEDAALLAKLRGDLSKQ